MLVGQILKNKAISQTITVEPDLSVGEAAEILSTKKIGAVIVAKDPETPLGILSERDVVRELGRSAAGCLTQKVSDLMTSKLITCQPDETALQVLEKMSRGRFRHMPVLDGEKLVGIVSIGDVVKARLEQLAMENDALEGMIMGH